MLNSLPNFSSRISKTQLERRFFEAVCLTLSLVMMFIAALSLINLGVTTLLIVDFSLVLVGVGFYVMSRHLGWFHLVRFLFIAILFIACISFWFWLDGIHGSSPYALIATCVVSMLIVDARHRWPLLILSLVIIGTLIVIQVETDWVQDLSNSKQKLGTNLFVFSTAILFIIAYIKIQYDAERSKSQQRNSQLQDLNEQLEDALMQKDAVILQLRSTKDQLVESEKTAAIGKLTAGLAHELNNPLNYIGGVVTPIEKDLLELKSLISEENQTHAKEIFEEIQQLLDTLSSGTKRASEVVRNLVRLSPNTEFKTYETLPIKTLLEDVYNMMEQAHQEIHFEIKMEEGLLIYGNMSELTQAFIQLIQNSIQAVAQSAQPQIGIELIHHAPYADIVISDNGVGIPASDIPQIYDPFFTTKGEGQGAGLGLFLCYSIIKKHHGDILVESSAVNGTFITVRLPLKE